MSVSHYHSITVSYKVAADGDPIETPTVMINGKLAEPDYPEEHTDLDLVVTTWTVFAAHLAEMRLQLLVG